jgi:hypothetical protein
VIDPNRLLYLQIVIAVAAAVSSGMLVRKAVSFHSRLWLGIAVYCLSVVVFSYLATHIPLYSMSNSSHIQDHLTVDIMMFGSLGLVIAALIGFAIDHMYERPSWLMVAAAASLSIGVFPFFYGFNREKLNQQYKINIVQPIDPSANQPAPVEDTTEAGKQEF